MGDWKCGNDGKGSRPWFVYREQPATGQIAEYHRPRNNRGFIRFASHDAAHRRMLSLNEGQL